MPPILICIAMTTLCTQQWWSTNLLQLVYLPDEEIAITTGHFSVCYVDHILMCVCVWGGGRCVCVVCVGEVGA